MMTDTEYLDWLEANCGYFSYGKSNDYYSFWPHNDDKIYYIKELKNLSIREYFDKVFNMKDDCDIINWMEKNINYLEVGETEYWPVREDDEAPNRDLIDCSLREFINYLT